MKSTLSLFLIALYVSLFFGEVIARYYYSVSDEIPAYTDYEYCARKLHRHFVDINGTKPLYPADTNYFHFHDVLGYIPASNFHSFKVLRLLDNNGSIMHAVIRGTDITSQNTRGLTEVTSPKTGVRIGAFGDSFTFGSQMHTRMSYPYIMQRLYDIEVMNFGVEGSDLHHQFLRMILEAPQYDLDAIIWAIYADDIRRTGLPCSNYLRRSYTIQGSDVHISEQPLPPPDVLLKYKEPVIESYLLKWIWWTINHKPEPQRQYSKGFNHLQKQLTYLSTLDIPIVIFLINDDTGMNDEAFSQLVSIVSQTDFPYVTSTDIFSEATPDYPLENGSFYEGHFTVIGNGIVAQALGKQLTSLDLLSDFDFFHVSGDKKQLNFTSVDKFKTIKSYDLVNGTYYVEEHFVNDEMLPDWEENVYDALPEKPYHFWST